MRKIIYKIWQAIRSWIQKQEELYEKDYMRGICKRFHRAYPECKFKCYYDVFDENTFILHLDAKYATLRSALEFLDEEQRVLSFMLPGITFIYDHYNDCDVCYYNPISDIIIYETK